jgi:hypothetical protein
MTLERVRPLSTTIAILGACGIRLEPIREVRHSGGISYCRVLRIIAHCTYPDSDLAIHADTREALLLPAEREQEERDAALDAHLDEQEALYGNVPLQGKTTVGDML